MRWNISAASIRNPLPAILLFLVLIACGIMSFMRMPISKFPNIDIPIVQIVINQTGASPTELESQVTKLVENAVSSIRNIWHIDSKIADGQSTTIVQFYVGTDIATSLNKVKDVIAYIRKQLPSTISEPIISSVDVDGDSILTYAASSSLMNTEELSWFVDDTIVTNLQALPGVGSVYRFGGTTREIRVALDLHKLLALGITANNVNDQISAKSSNLAGGRINIPSHELPIRTISKTSDIAQLAAIPISLPDGGEIRLDSIAKVIDGQAEERSFSLLNNQPVITFNIARAKGASDVSVANDIAQKIDELRKIHPDITIQEVDSQVVSTLEVYHSTIETLIEGAILTVAVVWFFLRDWRATFIAATALPLSIIPTFLLMHLMDFSLNNLSMLAITIVTGILVDDALVEIENIVRHIREGTKPYRASIEAADEIGLAVIAISLALAAIFTPVSFMAGIPGQYFRQFGLTVAIAVLISLLVARLITPVIAAFILREHQIDESKTYHLLNVYCKFVQSTLKHRWITIFISVVLLGGSIASTMLMPSDFLPASDYSRATFELELPPNSTIDDTKAAAQQVTNIIKDMPEVKNVLINASVNSASIVIDFIKKNKRSLSQQELTHIISQKASEIPDIRFYATQSHGNRDISLKLVGDDTYQLQDVAAKLVSEMREISSGVIANPSSTAELNRNELHIIPKQQAAADLGVSITELSNAIFISTIGPREANLPQFDAGNRMVPIRTTLDEKYLSNINALKSLRVLAKNGTSVPLGAIADFKIGQGLSAINRYDRKATIAIEADLGVAVPLGTAIDTIFNLPTAQNLPPGVLFKGSGDAEVMHDIFASFMIAMVTGLLVVFAVLSLLFGGFAQPLTILLSLPFAISGVVIALSITGQAISMPVVIGILMVLGIVTKNAIMIVDFAIEAMKQGHPRVDALIEAVRKRARPIVMTTAAMAMGMLPAAFALGEGGEFRSPMAIAIIGGLLMSTMLSMLLVPAIFTVMDDISCFMRRTCAKYLNSTE